MHRHHHDVASVVNVHAIDEELVWMESGDFQQVPQVVVSMLPNLVDDATIGEEKKIEEWGGNRRRDSGAVQPVSAEMKHMCCQRNLS